MDGTHDLRYCKMYLNPEYPAGRIHSPTFYLLPPAMFGRHNQAVQNKLHSHSEIVFDARSHGCHELRSGQRFARGIIDEW